MSCAAALVAALFASPVWCCLQAAADSPFLDNLLPCASGVLCVLSLPERVLSHDLDMSPGALNDPEKYAIRAAVQVGRWGMNRVEAM